MSSGQPPRERAWVHEADLIERLHLAGREVSSSTVLFNTTVAQLRRLSVTEEKAVDLLLRAGSMTHADLVERTGLAPASVSDLIDRLESKGYAHRGPHPRDGRRVLVTADAERISADLAPLFSPWARELEELYATYTGEELEIICDFLTKVAARQHDAALRLAR